MKNKRYNPAEVRNHALNYKGLKKVKEIERH